MKKMSTHTEWLSLIEIAGPFLATPVLEKIFPQGLEVFNTHSKRRLRQAYEEWRDAVEENDPLLNELHLAWNELVLKELLEFENSVLYPVFGNEELTFRSLDSDGLFTPDYALRSESSEKPMLLISIFPQGTDLQKVKVGDEWPVSIQERMTLLCRAKDIRFGLISNGEQWMLVHAPIGSSSSNVSWYANLWFQEEVTLRAFRSLLGVRRWFGAEDQSLANMLDQSREHLDEVTDTLGEQVRRAVEVLVQSLDKADQDRNRELLQNVSPMELYEAGLTVMMRLVFILCAEERGLLLLGDPVYDQYYAVTTLRSQLAEDADRHGHEVLERRHDGWARILATFRSIYGGVEHDILRMPALGGSLFDPDRFSFLEGRAKGTSWKDTPAQPLPIDNRTVLLLLEALQVLEQKGGALMLSYKALDVEQIGHVYEGLLEYTVQRMTSDTLGLLGSQKVKFPNITLTELESAEKSGMNMLVSVIKNATERSEVAIENALKKGVENDAFAKVLVACGGDTKLAKRIEPYARFIRTDARDEFIVYRAGAFAVTHGTNRRETGTHYTPKSLTENTVETTLIPIVYIGPTDGKPREEWQLRSSAELLDLKICDSAMGSGAFLVQVCRWLSERLVDAWGKEEMEGRFISIDGRALAKPGNEERMPSSLDERLLIARRLIAERCLYGVDLNPLAVELAKLSIWLITLAKGRPFGFLDHNLRSGDSLLGIHKLDQLTRFSINPQKKQAVSLFASSVHDTIENVVALRKKIRETTIIDILDIQYMERLDKESRQKLKNLLHVADAIIGDALVSGGDDKVSEGRLDSLSSWAADYLMGDPDAGEKIISHGMKTLSVDLTDGKATRKPFHWALEFPEVFERGGFDGIVGNPPFYAGAWLKSNLGEKYRAFIVKHIANGRTGLRGTADLCVYFLLRNTTLMNARGKLGLVLSSSIIEGDSKEVGTSFLVNNDYDIYRATSKMKWPGKASVEIVLIWLMQGKSSMKKMIDQKEVDFISSSLTIDEEYAEPFELSFNKLLICKGHELQGDGFKVSLAKANELLSNDARNAEVIFPLITGDIINNSIDLKSDSYVINFGDRSIESAGKFTEVMEIVKKYVKPERDLYTGNTGRDKYLRTNWWLFRGFRNELQEFSEKHDRFLVLSVVSKYRSFAFVPSHYIPTAATSCFLFDSYTEFSNLQSTIHEVWAENFGSSLGETLRYIAGRCFKTFPLAKANSEKLLDVGERYDRFRSSAMAQNQKGLTDTYNLFHSSKDSSEVIRKLRDLHVEMDEAVAAAYGWNDLNLDHGFYATKQGVRFFVPEKVRLEILQRLIKLNHETYEIENRKSQTKKKKK